jgi:thioester reductase-like protein
MSTGTVVSSAAEAGRTRQSALMQADAVLPPDVMPADPGELCAPRTVLLTGATGFLGRYAARALLRNPGLELVCLVRGADDAHARQRLATALEAVGVSAADLAHRVQVVRGETGVSRFGLDRAAYAALAGRIDVVHHCAAEVNWARGYRQLRATNVLGVLEAIRFACAVRAKPLTFVSTIAVCFAQGDAASVDEDTDPIDRVDAMPLGYAQSKCVAEHLLRQAAARGLPVTILRPALISGDSATGDVNLEDLIAALVEGCARTGLAIDVDWLLDCVPVDFVADVLARVPPAAPRAPQVLHLVHERARHWRELVLWMNLYGYAVRLLPTHEWLDAAFVQGTAEGTRLYGYRRFFQGVFGHSPRPFEAYLEPHQRRVRAERTQARLAALGIAMPPMDAPLLHRYFERYRRAGVLPGRTGARDAVRGDADALALFGTVLRRRSGLAGLRVVAAEPVPFASANGILNEIASARLGGSVGIQRYRVTVARGAGFTPITLDALVKTKAADETLKSLTVDLAAVCDPRLGALFDRHRDDLGLTRCHERELALYEVRDARLRRHTPRCFGVLHDPAAARWTLALEYVRDVDTGDVTADAAGWDTPRLAAAIEGLATLQAAGAAVRDAPAGATLVPERTAATMASMADLWAALAEYAGGRFRSWSPGAARVQRELVETLDRWWPQVLALPQTLVHNDFNPRNLALRITGRGWRLCAFDWELAGYGLPQRDLAELLCFVAGDRTADLPAVAAWAEQHRRALAAAGGPDVDAEAWRAGLALAVRHFIVTRLPMYALIHRFRPQRFLPAVVRDAMRLHATTQRWLPRA